MRHTVRFAFVSLTCSDFQPLYFFPLFILLLLRCYLEEEEEDKEEEEEEEEEDSCYYHTILNYTTVYICEIEI